MNNDLNLLEEAVQRLELRIIKNKSRGSRINVSSEILRLADQVSGELVCLCETQYDYQTLLSVAVSNISAPVEALIEGMNGQAFGRCCRRIGKSFPINDSYRGVTALELFSSALFFEPKRDDFGQIIQTLLERYLALHGDTMIVMARPAIVQLLKPDAFVRFGVGNILK